MIIKPSLLDTFWAIHHTVGTHYKTVEDIRREHVAKGYSDVGYHRIKFPDGVTREGRPMHTMGAHALGLNDRSRGYCVVGNFDIEVPSEALIRAIVQDLTILCRATRTAPENIIGHCDVARMLKRPAVATACPGKHLYARLPDIRREVAKRI